MKNPDTVSKEYTIVSNQKYYEDRWPILAAATSYKLNISATAHFFIFQNSHYKICSRGKDRSTIKTGHQFRQNEPMSATTDISVMVWIINSNKLSLEIEYVNQMALE
ncbi:hypothetical protein BB561_003188 [Smittium simulii]|uniref:Uncharacterized protein n=1 Tax=Smittium simulii TaxID=133385 RepID=A0A2T9YMT4_9FUNG|nr:hypothetical protein BB561_003188 [Smittium simulii]